MKLKNVLFLMSAIMMITISSYGQTVSHELTGAIGLTFGMDKATVKSILSAKGTFHGMIKPDVSGFSDVSIGSKKAGIVMCGFVNDKLYRILCIFTPEAENTSKAQELYDEFTTILTTKYGKTSNSFRLFDYPFEDKESDWDIAIETSKATIDSFWNLPDKETGNSIALSINKDFTVHIDYQSKTLRDIVIEKEKSKNTDAF
jgi:hypothetical protein